MSSMRNAVQRRNHRERGQPEERKRLGLLEKHKDYSLRAKDFQVKKTKLASLRKKILEKNPDEFYFGMMSKKGPGNLIGKKGTGTVNGDRGNKALSAEAARLFKTQDTGYLRTMANKTRKEVEELERKVVGIRGHGRKVVFADTEEEQRERMGEVEDVDMDSDEEDSDDKLPNESLEERKLRKLQEKEAGKLESKLAISRERLKALTEAEEALDMQRARMAKSPTVGGVNKNGVKFKVRERKR